MSPAASRHEAQASEHGHQADDRSVASTTAQVRRRYLEMAGSGLVAALIGSITRPAEIRTRGGTPMLVFGAVPDGARSADEPTTTIRIECLDDVDALAPSLTKGTQVYVEGRLSLSTWTARDGAERTGLRVEATHIEILVQ